MDDFKLLFSTVGSVLRNSRQLKAILGCGALALVVVVALIGGMNALTGGNSGGGDATAQEQAEPTSGSDGSATASASETQSAAETSSATTNGSSGEGESNPNQADATLAKTSIDETGPRDLMCSYAWADVSTGTGYAFDAEGNMTPTTGSAKAYALSDAKKSDPSTSTYDESGSSVTVTKTVYTFVITLGDEEAKSAVLTVLEYSDGRATTLTLSSSAFAHDLTASPKNQAVTIEDSTGSGRLSEAMGDQAQLEAALSTWCQGHAVGTTKATWNGKCSVDYSLSTSTISLTLNNTAKKTVTCVRNPDGNYAFYF